MPLYALLFQVLTVLGLHRQSRFYVHSFVPHKYSHASCVRNVMYMGGGSSNGRNGNVLRTEQRNSTTSTIARDIDKSTTSMSTNTFVADTKSASFFATAVPGPPLETKPDYDNIHGPLGKWMDVIFMYVFRLCLAQQVDNSKSAAAVAANKRKYDDFLAITDLALLLNRQSKSPTEIQAKAETILLGLFPSWMPPMYKQMFSKPFPKFSARMNAWATRVAGVWLMGPGKINDVILDDGSVGQGQGLLVERCRFLEESGCASVCVNSCKVPTQSFFAEHMGIPLTMEPNYETYECQFSFGKSPTLETESVAMATPCLMRCPSVGQLRTQHENAGRTTEEAITPPCPQINSTRI